VAAARRGTRTLVVSTDPAPSLADAFIRPLGSDPRAIPTRRGILHAVEIDAPAALGRWLEDRRKALERIALRGTWLDQDDVSRLLQLSLPGIDELAALLEVSRLAATGAYDLVVVDTAPTGHTLRMFDTPEVLAALASVFDSMQDKHRVVVSALRGRWSPDAEDVFISGMDDDAKQLAALLRDPGRAQYSWITLPEMMAVEETADAVSALAQRGITVSRVIVNRITTPPERPCAWCDARRIVEARSFEALRQKLPAIAITSVSARESEPRGIRALTAIGAEIEAGSPLPGAVKARGKSGGRFRIQPSKGVVPRLGTPETRLLLFGGKGGVGKTTCAAAAAAAIALQSPERRVLLVSTDPAHSLGDVLAAPISDAPGALPDGPPNLTVREFDAAHAFRVVRQRYATAIDHWFDRLVRGAPGSVGVDASLDRRVMHGLMDLAPPGIDELTAVIDVIDALEERHAGGADIVVMDTAPSGHALRLLEMPQLAQDWARALMSILLKYQPVTGVGELGAVLLRISQGLGRLKALLTDPAKTSFIAVTRAATLPREETARLLQRLAAMHVDVPVVIVNAVGRGTCARCRAAAGDEQRQVRRMQRFRSNTRRESIPVAVAPAELPPPRGLAALLKWHSSWRIAAPGKRILS
jgi:arsenite/tail-anchored protein-transporting ATPase